MDDRIRGIMCGADDFLGKASEQARAARARPFLIRLKQFYR